MKLDIVEERKTRKKATVRARLKECERTEEWWKVLNSTARFRSSWIGLGWTFKVQPHWWPTKLPQVWPSDGDVALSHGGTWCWISAMRMTALYGATWWSRCTSGSAFSKDDRQDPSGIGSLLVQRCRCTKRREERTRHARPQAHADRISCAFLALGGGKLWGGCHGSNWQRG